MTVVADSRDMHVGLIISTIFHLLLLIAALMLTVLKPEPLPQFIEMSFGQPEPAQGNSQPIIEASSQPVVEEVAQPEPTAAIEQAAPAQPTPQPATPAKPALQQPSLVSTPTSAAPSEETITQPPKKKVDPKTRFTNTASGTAAGTTGDPSDSKLESGNFNDNDKSLPTATGDTSTKGQIGVDSDANSGPVSAGGSNDGAPRSGPTTPQGNTNLPVDIVSDLAGRAIIYQPFPQRIQGLTRDNVVEFIFTVNPDGTVRDIRPVKKGDPALEKASIDAFKQWRFNAANSENLLEVRVRVRSKLE